MQFLCSATTVPEHEERKPSSLPRKPVASMQHCKRGSQTSSSKRNMRMSLSGGPNNAAVTV